MLNPEEQKFEKYLKEFRPRDLAPSPLKRARLGKPGIWIATAAALILAVVVIAWRYRSQPQPPFVSQKVGQPLQARPLTLGEANALLVNSPSIKSTLDDLAFSSQSMSQEKDKHSALAELSKEPKL